MNRSLRRALGFYRRKIRSGKRKGGMRRIYLSIQGRKARDTETGLVGWITAESGNGSERRYWVDVAGNRNLRGDGMWVSESRLSLVPEEATLVERCARRHLVMASSLHDPSPKINPPGSGGHRFVPKVTQ